MKYLEKHSPIVDDWMPETAFQFCFWFIGICARHSVRDQMRGGVLLSITSKELLNTPSPYHGSSQLHVEVLITRSLHTYLHLCLQRSMCMFFLSFNTDPYLHLRKSIMKMPYIPPDFSSDLPPPYYHMYIPERRNASPPISNSTFDIEDHIELSNSSSPCRFIALDEECSCLCCFIQAVSVAFTIVIGLYFVMALLYFLLA